MTQREHFDALVQEIRSSEMRPDKTMVQWAENLLIQALRVTTDEIEGALDAGPTKPEEMAGFKSRYSRILDALQGTENFFNGEPAE